MDDSVPTTIQYNKWISMRVLTVDLVDFTSIFVSFQNSTLIVTIHMNATFKKDSKKLGNGKSVSNID